MTTDMVGLPQTEALTEAEATEVTRSAFSQVIVIAGVYKSGKTTLLTSLYQLFLGGPFGGFRFAGSRTLLAFEKRCHLARTASNRATPETERTPLGSKDAFLHLRLRVEDNSQRAYDLLITDWPGEVFTSAKNSAEYCKQLTVLRRCDHFVLLVDGEQLTSLTGRHQARADADLLLRRCLEAGMIGNRTNVTVVFSKWDLIVGSSGSHSVSFVNEVKEEIRRKYEHHVESLDLIELAARPASSVPGAEKGLGMPELLCRWMAIRPTSPVAEAPIRNLPGGRHFNNLVTMRH